MILIVCVDDKNGMMFNKRRQSQDEIVRQNILKETANGIIWMNSYSASQFKEKHKNIQICEDFLDKAGTGEWCFVENVSVLEKETEIERIELFKWNRIYPSDFWFDIPLQEHGWKLESRQELAGHSHEKITKEIYVK